MRKLILVFAILFFLASIGYAEDVTLKWDASTGATGYKIYKSEDLGVTWSAPVDVGNVTTYTYLNIIETKMVLFKVSAYNSLGESVRHWSGAWYDHTKRPILTPGGTGIN